MIQIDLIISYLTLSYIENERDALTLLYRERQRFDSVFLNHARISRELKQRESFNSV